MKRTAFSFLLVLACLPILLFARLSILKPIGLQEWWDRKNGTQDIHTSIAAFGHIPWGKKILGHVELAEPLNACSFIRSDTTEQDTSSEPILIAVRGDCPFYLKAHYAQLAGAQMLIIVDNQYEDVEAKLMVDSGGQGESINIPSVLLGKSGGQRIIDSLKDSDPKINDIYVLFDFSIPKNDKVNYHLWLTSSSTQSFRFLKYWEPYSDKLDNITTMEPHFSHFQLPPPIDSASSPDEAKPNENNCICAGRYCSTDPDGDLPNNGRDVILEDLRQMCLIKEYQKEVWWKYIKNYDETCLSGGSMLACSTQIMKQIRVDPERIQDCVDRSFIGDSDLTKCTNNRLLNDEEEVMRQDGSFLFPSVFINGFMYRGSLVPGKGLFEAVCESFKDLPDACVEHFDNPKSQVSSSPAVRNIAKRHWPTALAVVIFLLIFGFFIFCCYRRHLKREMYRQMVRDVNVAVSQYIAFKDDEIGKAEEAT